MARMAPRTGALEWIPDAPVVPRGVRFASKVACLGGNLNGDIEKHVCVAGVHVGAACKACSGVCVRDMGQGV